MFLLLACIVLNTVPDEIVKHRGQLVEYGAT